MTAYETIRLERDGALAVVTLNRPDTLNSLNGRMRRELKHAFEQAPQDGARAILLTGEGRSFCSGQDLGEASRREVPDLSLTLRDEYEPMLKAMAECPIPTICAVNGVAAGAGASLALSTDLTIAAASAQFVIAFARIGLIPDAGSTWLLPKLVGLQRAMGLALTTEPLDGRKAAEWGLVWKAYDDDKFAAEARALGQRLAAGPTMAYRLMKNAIRKGAESGLYEQLAHESKAQGEAGRSRDFMEGVTAFLEKRPARYEGR